MMYSIFKYLFVGIIGMIILIFFINLAFQHGRTEETISAVILARTLDDNLQAFSMSENANKDINFNLETEFNLLCTSFGNRLIIKDQQVTIPRIIFSQQKFKGKKLHVFTKAWKLPFEITNFYYLSDPKTKIFLVYDSGTKTFVEDINKTIPARFRAEAVLSSTINSKLSLLLNSKDYDTIKVAFFTSSVPASQQNSKIKKIKFEAEDKGEVTFLTEGKSSSYLSREMLIGAIFAENYDDYDCARKRAIKKAKAVYELYIKKAEILRTIDQDCETYSSIIGPLNNIKNNLDSQNIDFTSLNQINRELRGDPSCVNIF